ncbi:MAG: Tim44-like domain-containing protein [Hydrogenovibrio sp.]|uniref:Tim44 domain-containing protein n=1 Tax=Hydrogenovibrio sp. TaxID=2065821 RepID=UPI0028704C60|nr:Tim44-like domain-containing protein [Hydrogenovibrio sp.]MDR9497762.1 Tim44-like domain-containing protein [Hydrogenovibrio sp.]
MKRLLTVLTGVVFMLGLVAPQAAEAKRFGGGGSFGKKYSEPTQQRQQPSKQQQQAQRQQTVANSGTSRFLGPLAGLAAGGLLAWMFFGDGFDGLQIMDLLLFALIAFGLFALFKRFAASQMTARQTGQGHGPFDLNQQRTNAAADLETASPGGQGSIIGSGLGLNALHRATAPEWFRADSFEQSARAHFVAVQNAWDDGDASEIESYCTPELYLALQDLMHEVVPGENHTEVDTLYTEIVDQIFDEDYFVVSVRFHGFIKEDKAGSAHAFDEIWHIRRLTKGEGNWQIAGIQQTHEA